MGSYIFYSLNYFLIYQLVLQVQKLKTSQNCRVLPLGSPQYYYCFSTELLEMFNIPIAFKLKNECTLTCSFSCSCIDTLQNRIRCFDLSLSYTVVCFVVSLNLTLIYFVLSTFITLQIYFPTTGLRKARMYSTVEMCWTVFTLDVANCRSSQ